MKFLIVLALLFTVALAYKEKIEPEVYNRLSINAGKATVFVDMKETVEFSTLKHTLSALDHIQKGRFIVDRLISTAQRSQAPVRHILDITKSRYSKYENLWIQNSLLIHGADETLIEKLAKRDDVKSVRFDRIVQQDLEKAHPFVPKSAPKGQPEWNVKWVNAHKVWANGHNGAKMVIGISDTGVQHNHEALIEAYRGNKNGEINHNFNWFDPHGNSAVPLDQNGHGTHVTGTAAGGIKGKKIGIAPGAKWINCRSFSGSGRASNFVKCNQWFLAPTDLSGNNPNPDLRPHATSHSYVCRGCGLRPSIQAMFAAGIFFIKSCGNSGSRCRTITEPGNYPEVYCMAALNKESNTVASFSSRGPATDGHQKPSFAGPGAQVLSAVPGRTTNGYRAMSGTSMAAPLMNGAIALFWSAVPELERKLEETIEVLKKSSLGQEASGCGETSKTPNYTYGYGTLNLEKAVEYAIKKYRK